MTVKTGLVPRRPVAGVSRINPEDDSRNRREFSRRQADCGESVTSEAAFTRQLSRLQAELERAEEEVRLTMENCKRSTGHLQDSNDQLSSLNKELEAATRELMASRAQLQMANDQLAQLNQSYLDKIAEVSRSNSDLRNLMAAANIGALFLDRELRIKNFTPQIQDMLPIYPENLGCPVNWLADRIDYPILPEDSEAVLRTLQPREAELNLRDGRCFLSRVLPYRTVDDTIDGVVLTLFDISDRKKTEAARLEETERAQITLASIAEGVIITDPEGRVESINPRAELLTGRTSASSRELPWRQVAPIRREDTGSPIPDVVQQCLREQRTIEPGEPATLIRRDGTEAPVEISVAPIRSRTGQGLGAIIVLRDISEHRRLIRQISYQATHDDLTGLINRQEFERRLSLMLQRAREFRRQHALCYLDLDQFKVINDTFGHVAGDALLRQVSGLLQVQVRRERDTLARLGGDEFGLLLGECGLDRAMAVAEQLRESIQNFCFVWDNRPFRIGVSIGVTPITGEAPDISSLLSTADSACYMAKDRGRNCVQAYRPDAEEIVQRRCEMRWIYRLQQALSEGRFRLHFQPIVPIGREGDSGIHGEVLLRMLDEDGQILLPGAFVPAAERYHQMIALDRWVIGTAFSLLRDRGICPAEQCYAINLSAQSLGNSELLGFIDAQLDETGVSPSRVCFEVTETATIANLPVALEFMNSLRAKGCRFALDDFGSGLSSFGHLKNLPVDYLKIDGGFVRHIVDDPIDCAMVETINRVGHLMGLKTVAECVESSEILEKLQSLGVDYAQGYGISEVLPFEQHMH